MAPRGPRRIRLEWLSLPLLLLIWQGAALVAQSRFVPSPLVVAGEIVDLTFGGPLLADFGKTLTRAAIAFGVAMALGGVLGFVFGRVSAADRLFGPCPRDLIRGLAIRLRPPAVVRADYLARHAELLAGV